ncbi:MAG: rhomboid family intramembrane serine protease [Nanoarchaeota archaeon]|nr:rhomboid family intramembrane serine protease [Nanoarchaeota archaeon]
MTYPVTKLIIAINVIVFLLVFSFPETARELIFLSFSFSAGTSGEIWRWITSMFLHVSASHIVLNMLGLWYFGKVLERSVSRQWFLAIYFISGLLGNFAFMMTSGAPVVGASGAVFGVLGAAMLLNPMKPAKIFIFPLPLGIVGILFLLFETMVIFFQPVEFGHVATIAHIAGVIAGGMFGAFYKPKQALKSSLFLAVSLILLIALNPIFSLITSVGGFIHWIIEQVAGLVLYTLAALLSYVWAAF